MMEESKRSIPTLDDGDFQVKSIFNIDEIIGSDEDLCTAHYSAPNIEYNYGYNYIGVCSENYIWG